MNKNFYNNEEQFSKQQLQGNRTIHELKLRQYAETMFLQHMEKQV